MNNLSLNMKQSRFDFFEGILCAKFLPFSQPLIKMVNKGQKGRKIVLFSLRFKVEKFIKVDWRVTLEGSKGPSIFLRIIFVILTVKNIRQTQNSISYTLSYEWNLLNPK